MAKLSKSNIKFYFIEGENAARFIEDRQTNRDLSDFHAAALKIVGDTIRPRGSQFFWNDGEYCWYTDATQTKVHRLWQTNNGILIYEDTEYLYRVMING